MDLRTFARSGFRYYARTNAAVIAGVAIAVAVLTGALITGDSVRHSLRGLVLKRLGNTTQVLTSAQFFREALATESNATPIIALEGVVSKQENNQRAGGVQVYGIDERFWSFHGLPNKDLAERDAFLSPGLAEEIQAKTGDNLLLRIEKPSAIPRESLHGRKEDAGKTIRFKAGAILGRGELGEFALKSSQGAVKAIFLKLRRLQKDLEQTGRVNTLLFAANVPADLSKVQLGDLGVKLVPVGQDRISIETESAVVGPALEASVPGGQPFFTYLVNSISVQGRSAPYSLITGVTPEFLQVSPGEIVLNEWAALDLAAKPGDPVAIEYYLWDSSGVLLTRQASFKLVRTIPTVDDRTLAPTYPGITESSTLADWDPPFPMDLKKVRPIDEDYWKKFRTTPKGYIHIDDAKSLWRSRFGNATSLRVPATPGFEAKLRAATQPQQLGMALVNVRELSLQASIGSTDFGEYFLYFSFFLAAAALILTVVFFQLNLEQRLREIGLLRALGFDAKQTQRHFLREGLPLAFIGSLIGVALGVAYSAFILFGLRTWWRGAVGTSELTLHLTAAALQAGLLAGVVTSALTIFLALRGLRKSSPRDLLSGSRAPEATTKPSPGLAYTALALIAAALGLSAAGVAKAIPAAGAFFGAGFLLLTGGILWIRNRLKGVRNAITSLSAMGLRNATWKPNRSALCITLIAFSVFLLLSLEAFRQGDSTEGSGGFSLVAESQLPIVHDLNSPAGREALNLKPAEGTRFFSFRLKPGDDASCLNLYEPRNPRVLGASEDFLSAKRFGESTPWHLLNQPLPGGIAPAIADANSMQYVLHKKVGDRITLPNGATLQFVAALTGSVLQGEILISANEFTRLFPEEQGYRYFLIEGPESNAAVLEDALSDFGLDVTTSREKLAAYHRVENTYLSTFQTLGALGLLLGIAGLAAVLMRNVLERRREFGLLRAAGYEKRDLSKLVVAENAYLVATGAGLGLVCAMVAILPTMIDRGWRKVPGFTIAALLLGVAAAGLLASLAAVRFVRRLPLLGSLRADA